MWAAASCSAEMPAASWRSRNIGTGTSVNDRRVRFEDGPFTRGIYVEARVVQQSDVAPVAALLAGAFFSDPVWAWLFPDSSRRREQHATVFELFVAGAVVHQSAWMVPGRQAVAVWIPPGCAELPEPLGVKFGSVIEELLGSRSTRWRAKSSTVSRPPIRATTATTT